MRKHRKGVITFFVLLMAATAFFGFLLYKQNSLDCRAETPGFPACKGGCANPEFYNKNVTYCKSV